MKTNNKSNSENKDNLVTRELTEDEEALRDFELRENEPTITFEEILEDLKDRCKI